MNRTKKLLQVKKEYIYYGVIIAFFIGVAITCPPKLYGDSEQFISMHVHREPVYPLFLWFFRTLFGENIYLNIAAWAQNLLNAFASIIFLRFFVKEFELNHLKKVLATIFILLPHIMTPLMSQAHIVLSSAVMNEAIGLPLFLLYIVVLLDYIYRGKKSTLVGSVALGLLLSLIRGSMMITLIAWMLVVTVRFIYEKKWKFILLPLLAMLMLFGVRGTLFKVYNYVVNDIYVATVCGNMNLVTNILYASERSSGELIEDDLSRELYYKIYDAAWENGLNHHFAGTNLYDRTAHLENNHDTLKFDYILQITADYYYENIGDDYLARNIWQDEVCANIAHSILPSCLGRWIGQYIMLSINGLVRSVAFVHPMVILPVLFMLFFAFGLCMYSFIKKTHQKEALAVIIALMMVFANAFGTATVIMCLSRYMIYGFSLFYITFGILIFEYGSDLIKHISKIREKEYEL